MSNNEKHVKETNEFIKEYLVDPTRKYTTQQIVDSLQEYLITKGYGIDQFDATVEYVTGGGKNIDFSGFLETEGDSKFARALADLDVAKIYSYYATISGFAKPVGELYDNLSKLENYKNGDGSYTAEGNQLLEDSLYAFIKAVNEGANLIPGGFTFSTLTNEMIPIIGDGIDIINGEIGEIEISIFEGNIDPDNYYYSSIYNLREVFENGGSWENGPSLEELEDIYNNCTGTEIFDEYLAWRIQYEFEEILKAQGIDIQEYYDKMNKLAGCDIEETDSSENWFDAAREWLRNIFNDILQSFEAAKAEKPCTPIYSSSIFFSHILDPLILDLDGDGYNVENKENGTNFDLDKNGFAEKINWTTKDGILTLDLNGNGEIDNGGEVFGDNTLLANGTKASNGFEALAQYDSNGDGVIDVNDSIFGDLRVWIDGNGDGISTADELKTLDEIGIESISLDYTLVNGETGTEATIGNAAAFTYANGTNAHAGVFSLKH